MKISKGPLLTAELVDASLTLPQPEATLSAESLRQLPDASQTRFEALFGSNTNVPKDLTGMWNGFLFITSVTSVRRSRTFVYVSDQLVFPVLYAICLCH
jgi:hypothetical protein